MEFQNATSSARAGHGVQVGGRNFLIPIGADINREPDVPIEAVSTDSILGQMEFAGNRLNFVILDSCRNNPYASGFRSSAPGLAEMGAARGTLVAYSTGPGEVALDGNEGNSPYTLALAKAMLEPGLSAGDMFQQVRETVIQATDEQQVPWETSSLRGRFSFQEKAEAVDPVGGDPVVGGGPVVPRGPSETAEIAFWDSIKDSGNAADFQAYLDARAAILAV